MQESMSSIMRAADAADAADPHRGAGLISGPAP